MNALRSLAAALLFALAIPAYAASTYHVAHTYPLGVSGGWDYLTLDAPAHTLFIAQGDKVLVFDTVSGTVTGTIPGLGRTHSVILSADGKTIYVSDSAGNVVHIIDRATLTPTGVIPVGTGPDAMVLEPVTGHLFAFNGKSKDLTVIDLTTNKVIATVPLPGRPEFPVADGAGNVYDNIEDLHQLIRIDAAQNKIAGTITFDSCEDPSGQAIDTVRKRVFSVCSNGYMTITAIPTLKQITTAPIGKGPDAAVFDPARKLVFSSNGASGTLSIIQERKPDEYSLIQTVDTALRGRTLALNPATGDIYIVATDPTATGTGPKPLVLLEISK
jgi:YVTN family beta-propeller protein